MRLEETIAIAALCQAVIAKLYKLHEQNLSFRHYSRALIMENKWRAARYGLDGKLIDFGKQTEVPVRELIARDTGVCERRRAANWAAGRRSLTSTEFWRRATAPTRQLRVFQETNDLKQVVDYMIAETEHGLFEATRRNASERARKKLLRAAI